MYRGEDERLGDGVYRGEDECLSGGVYRGEDECLGGGVYRGEDVCRGEDKRLGRDVWRGEDERLGRDVWRGGERLGGGLETSTMKSSDVFFCLFCVLFGESRGPLFRFQLLERAFPSASALSVRGPVLDAFSLQHVFLMGVFVYKFVMYHNITVMYMYTK